MFERGIFSAKVLAIEQIKVVVYYFGIVGFVLRINGYFSSRGQVLFKEENFMKFVPCFFLDHFCNYLRWLKSRAFLLVNDFSQYIRMFFLYCFLTENDFKHGLRFFLIEMRMPFVSQGLFLNLC